MLNISGVSRNLHDKYVYLCYQHRVFEDFIRLHNSNDDGPENDSASLFNIGIDFVHVLQSPKHKHIGLIIYIYIRLFTTKAEHNRQGENIKKKKSKLQHHHTLHAITEN